MAIISTPVGGIPEIVKNGVNGHLVKPGDRSELYNIILNVIDNIDNRLEMGEESYKFVKSYFPDFIEKQLALIYKNI